MLNQADPHLIQMRRGKNLLSVILSPAFTPHNLAEHIFALVRTTGTHWKFYFYTWAVIGVGLVVLVHSLRTLSVTPGIITDFAVLTVGMIISQLLMIRTPRREASYDPKPALIFTGILVLPHAWLPLLILSSSMVQALKGQTQRRILEPLFNFAQFTIAAALAAATYRAISPYPALLMVNTDFLAVTASMVMFMLTQLACVTSVVALYHQVDWRQTECINPNNIIADFMLLCAGAIIGHMWYMSGWAVLLACVPVYGLHLSLRLSQDIASLREVDRLKTNMVANVSHELRSPLTSIKLYTELLQANLENNDPETRQQFLKVIDQQSNQLLDLINDLLEASRLESGRVELHLQPVSLNQIVKEVVSLFAIQAEKKHITLQTFVEPDLPVLQADRELIKLLVKNIVSNAIKYNVPDGRVDIRLQAKEAELILTLTDTGKGIPEEALPHIFDKFYRAQCSIDSEVQGTGLGLALTKEAVELHGGHIKVHSQVGTGSCFEIHLPVSQGGVK